MFWTTHSVHQSLVSPFLSMNVLGQEAVPGLTEGKSLLKEQEAETPGLLPPSLPTLTLSNSKLQHSCKFRTCKFPRTAGSLGVYANPQSGLRAGVSPPSPLSWPDLDKLRGSDRLVSDKTRRQTFFFLARLFILKLKWI